MRGIQRAFNKFVVKEREKLLKLIYSISAPYLLDAVAMLRLNKLTGGISSHTSHKTCDSRKWEIIIHSPCDSGRAFSLSDNSDDEIFLHQSD